MKARFAVAAVAVLSGVARGEDGALPCRPTVACTADLVAPGHVEIETGYLFEQPRPGAQQHSIPFLTKLTLADWVQLQIGGNGPTWAPGARYFDDLVIGLKLHLHDQTPRVPSLSWSVSLSAPLESPLGWDLFFTFYMSKDFSWLHADLNLGLEVWQLDATTQLQPWGSLALSVALPRHVGVEFENYYFVRSGTVAADGGLLLALQYTPRPWLVLDAGCNVGYLQRQRQVSAFAGATTLLPRLWR
jgi:hypothetical protein